MKYLRKKLLGNEIFGSMVSWATKCFFEKLAKSFTYQSLLVFAKALSIF